MSEKNFASYGDMETLVTEIADKCGPYTEISYEDWLKLTPYQQEHGRWDVTGVPGADGTISIDLMTKLWENPDPSQSFADQQITLSNDNYDLLLIIGKYESGSNGCISVITEKGMNAYLDFPDYINGSAYSRYRGFSRVDSTHYNVSHCYGNGIVNDNFCIPLTIYGIKLHHTVEIKAIAPEVSTLAKNSAFDPTGTGLESTNAEDAIKELESNFQDGVDAVYDAVVAKGSTPASHSLSDVVDGIASIETSPPTQTKSCTPSTSAQTITPDSGYLLSSVSVGAIATQEKSCTPSTSAQTITPDSGYLLSSVSVGAIATQEKSCTPSTSAQAITPDSGKYLTKVSVGAIATQEKSCTPSTSAQAITPDSGKYLSQVSVSAISTQTKSCTPSTSAQTIKPDSGKYLSQVSVSAISTQTKTVTASRSAQNVTPDSGKYLTKVTINKYPDASGNYTCGSNNGAASSNDMGATNNYRYVNATKVYAKGKADGAATGTGGATEVWCFSNIGYGIQSIQGTASQTHTVNGWVVITIYDPEGARNTPTWGVSGITVKTVYDVGYIRIYNCYKAGNWTVTLYPTGRDGYATVCPLY